MGVSMTPTRKFYGLKDTTFCKCIYVAFPQFQRLWLNPFFKSYFPKSFIPIHRVSSATFSILEKTRDEEILEEIKKICNLLPSDLIDGIGPFLHPEAIRMILSDVMISVKTIEDLSNFRWCADEEALKLVEERLEKYGLAGYFFHPVAKETLYDTYAVLSHLHIV